MTDDERARFARGELERFSTAVLESVGVSRDRAELLTDVLVVANLRGVDTHGVTKLPLYVDNLEAGGFDPDPQVELEDTRPATVRVDADDGPGHVAASEGMAKAVELAKDEGVGFGTIANSNHVGMLAYYTLQAAEAGCIGLFTTNTLSLVAPFGGVDPFFGTNPIAVSVPTPREYHLTVDMATSTTAMNKVATAERRGESIPEGWAVDSEGRPVTDPAEVHALLPMGDHKGYGLALLVDVFAGLLSGMGPSPTANALSDPQTPQETGQFFGAIHVDAFVDPDAFAVAMDDLVDRLKSARTQPDVEAVMLPGEIEANVRADREKNGIPLSPETVDRLADLGERLDVAPPEPR